MSRNRLPLDGGGVRNRALQQVTVVELVPADLLCEREFF